MTARPIPNPSQVVLFFIFLCWFESFHLVSCWLVVPTTKYAPVSPSQYNSKFRYSLTLQATSNEKDIVPTMTTHDDQDSTKSTQKLILIRHARSEGNEFMARPGNQWGDATFCDDANLIDAKLTETGMNQVQGELLPKFQTPECADLLDQVDLVLVSPLTRTQQTFQYGVLPALQQQREGNMPPILAHPWSAERVYTASDTGRDKEVLSKEFPWVDWSLLEGESSTAWWYSHRDEDDAKNYQEWRPYGDGQWYAVPGEPHKIFEARMKKLEDWIAARDERTILLVVHWAVIRYLTGGYNSENCEIKVLDQWKPLHHQLGKL